MTCHFKTLIMKVNELRIGNIVCVDNEPYHPHLKDVLMRVVSIEHRHDLPEYSVSLERVVRDNSDVNVNYSQLIRFIKPVRLTEDILLKCGFENTPHFTVTDSKTLDIGRRRLLSIGSVEDCNQMMFIQSIHNDKITDLVCVHNYDYNGWLHLHQLQNIYFSLTGEELKIDL